MLLHSFVVFCFVGAISSLIDLGILYGLVEFFAFSVYVAATLSFTISSLNGYILNKLITFKDTSNKVKRQYVSYVLVNLIGLGLTLMLLTLFIQVFGLYYMHAKILTLAIVVLWNFGGSRAFVFKNRTH